MGAGGPPGLLQLPRTLLAGWACCPAEGVLKYRSVPPFLGRGGPDTDLGGGLGEGSFHSTWPWWPPSRPPWKMRVDSGLVSC